MFFFVFFHSYKGPGVICEERALYWLILYILTYVLLFLMHVRYGLPLRLLPFVSNSGLYTCKSLYIYKYNCVCVFIFIFF